MQPRLLLGSTLALLLGLSGAALADDHTSASREPRAAQAGYHVEMSREQIRQMQRALTARNLYQGKADGVWGPKTESALRNFQTQNGLEATGELNDPTAQALGLEAGRMDRQLVSGTEEARPAGTTPARPNLEDASTNVRLESLSEAQARELQQRLQLLGYYRGDVDGKVGEGTRVALQRYFQRQAELARQGVIRNAAINLFGTQANDVAR